MLLKDSGVSRRHVRIADRLGHFFVQDLGSSNGTLLNDKPLTGEQQLNNGDRISLGPVELVFKEVLSEEDATRPFMPVADEDFTRPIRRNLPAARTAEQEDLDDMLAPEAMAAPTTEFERVVVPPATPRTSTRSSLPAQAPRASTRSELPASGPPVLAPVSDAPARGGGAPRSVTAGERRAVASESPAPARSASRAQLAATSAPEAPPLALEVPTRTVSRAGMKAPPASAAAPARASGPEGLSAADKARRRRELGVTMGGQLTLWWSELSGVGRAALLLVALCFVGGMGAAVHYVFRSGVGLTGPSGPEPVTIGLQQLPDSFGLGEKVMWAQPDMKSFDFEFVSPTRAVAILRYQASDISKEEVSVSVNAVNVGWVPPDTINASEREVQQILSPAVLKRNERNTLVFDNVRNPPGREGWRVWNLRLEIIPVPDLPPEELLGTARNYVTRARDFYQRKDVGAENLFHAWDNYRSAWITLEALDQKPDLYHDVRYMLGQVAVDLDHKCGQLMLDFQRYIQFKDRKRARLVLQEVNRRFPTAAHRCHNLALDKANEYGI